MLILNAVQKIYDYIAEGQRNHPDPDEEEDDDEEGHSLISYVFKHFTYQLVLSYLNIFIICSFLFLNVDISSYLFAFILIDSSIHPSIHSFIHSFINQLLYESNYLLFFIYYNLLCFLNVDIKIVFKCFPYCQ